MAETTAREHENTAVIQSDVHFIFCAHNNEMQTVHTERCAASVEQERL